MFKNLEAELSRLDLGKHDIANAINKSYANTCCKLAGNVSFTLNEVIIIRDYINKRSSKKFTLDYLFGE